MCLLALIALLPVAMPGLSPAAALQNAPPAAQTSKAVSQPPLPADAQKEMEAIRAKGNEQRDKGNYDAALKTYQTGLEKARALKSTFWTIKFLNAHGVIYYYAGQMDKAVDYFRQTLPLLEGSGNDNDYAGEIGNIGSVLETQGHFTEALDYQNRALAIRQKLNIPTELALSYENLGNLYTDLAQFERALEIHNKALAIYQKVGSDLDIALVYNNIGKLYAELGNTGRSLEYHMRGLALTEKNGNVVYNARALYNVGVSYSDMGQFDKALDYLNRCIALFEKIGNQREMHQAITALGIIYSKLGQYEKARDYFQRVVTFAEKIGDQRLIVNALNNLGIVYGLLGQNDRALEIHQHELTITTKSGNALDIADSLANLGIIYSNLKQYKMALSYLQSAFQKGGSLGKPPWQAAMLNNLGAAYFHLGQYEKASKVNLRALALRENLRNPQDLSYSLNALGTICYHQGKFAQAKRFLVRSLKQSESIVAQLNDASAINTYLQVQSQEGYNRLARVEIAEGHLGHALATLEHGRGQGLAKQAAQSHVGLERFLTPDETADFRRQTEELTAATALLRAAQSRPIPETQAGQRDLIQQLSDAAKRYNQAVRSAQDMRDRLIARHPAYGRLQGARPPKEEELIALSRRHPDTLFLEYGSDGDQSFILFALLNGKLHVEILPATTTKLEQMATDWRGSLLGRQQSEPRLARGLYAVLLAPLERKTFWLKGRVPVRHLVVVAQKPLLDIPFAALLDGNGKRLCERVGIASAFSLGSLAWPQDAQVSAQTLLCAADPTGKDGETLHSVSRGGFAPLPSARREGQQIEQLFTAGRALFGGDATEAEVKREMGKYALLHFATHAFADSKNGLLSSLVLAPGGGEDGFLEAREIAEHPLAARLAVLSACETAQGEQSGGEGLLGLAWAFRAAGCPAIVASQWQVDDAATGRLMIEFYRGLRAGQSKDIALQQAMLAVKREAGHAAPYYWAAFQIIGDTSRLF